MEKEYVLKSFMVAVICLLASIASKPNIISESSGNSLLHTVKVFLVVSFFVILIWRIFVSVKK